MENEAKNETNLASDSLESDSVLTTGDSSRIEKAAFFWNSVSGTIVALQSVVILIVVSHVCGVVDAGVYTIAYASANLFLYIGNYGMRQFQASDRVNQFSFAEYRTSRLITCSAMLIASIAYLAWVSVANAYSFEKTAAVLTMCVFKLVDAFEDAYHGEYQRQGRLDVAARLLSLRMATSLCLLCAIVVASHTLLPALVASTAYTMLFFIAEVMYVRFRYSMPARGSAIMRNVASLLRECFPLFLAAFLLFYVGNAPRWAIDAVMDDASQAVFGYIMMPNFVVTLLASFIYNPMIVSLADDWREGNVANYTSRFIKIFLMVVILTVACTLAAWLIGAPVLGIMFNCDLQAYVLELALLIVGGGLLALLSLATLGLAIMRMQIVLIPVYCPVALVAFAISPLIVEGWGISGAVWVYLASMAVLAIAFSCCFAYGVKRRTRMS